MLSHTQSLEGGSSEEGHGVKITSPVRFVATFHEPYKEAAKNIPCGVFLIGNIYSPEEPRLKLYTIAFSK